MAERLKRRPIIWGLFHQVCRGYYGAGRTCPGSDLIAFPERIYSFVESEHGQVYMGEV